MQLYNQVLEVDVLKAICLNQGTELGITLLSTVDDSYFFSSLAQNIYKRISYLTKEKLKVPSWSQVLTDPVISEDDRDVLRGYESESEISQSNYRGYLDNLQDFRKARLLQKIVETATQELLKDKVDVENLYSQIITDIVSAKSGKDYSECFTKIGKSSNCNDKLKKLLIGDTLRFIPTGFGGWDSKNQGLPLGKMALVASTSGGGKSLMGIQLATNMALDGYRICIVPLEMSSEDMLHRMLANRTDMDMSEVAKGKKTEGNKRLKAYADFRAYEQMLANKNASIDLFEPPEDITMEDLLFVLQPYKYDVIIIDYIGLLKGFDGDNQWRKMGEAARFAKRWASTNNSTVMLMAQLNDDMIVRYSRAMKEHADLMWTWNSGKVSALENGEAIIKIEPQKGRNQEQSVFYLHSSFKKMRMTDASQEEIETYESKMKDNKPENNNKSGGKKFKIKDIEERQV